MDAGTTDDGIPYLIMEYVEGKPIDQFCRISRLSLDERLRLFIKACEAVSFAHRNLVIHRDLKPSNIIVSTDGEPKLLDFGISKKQVADADKPSTITNLGAMTPTYASPEQIKGEPLAITADLYSLGVILFKILTQLHPFGDTSIGHSALIETITTADPMLPSESRKSLTPEDEAGIGDLDFSKELKGDLDNIILKALRKEPERRYSTVDGLIDDLSRYLDGLPVNARPATIPYRAKKFYRRNKIPVLAGILAIFGLILGSSVAIWQASVARRQALVAESAQRSAERAAQKSKLEEENAKKITAFMEKMISYANPGLYAAGSDEQGNARVIDVINLMGTRIETEFPERKDLQAELHHKFAEVYVMIANPQFKSPEYREHLRRSRIHAKKALELRKEFFGEKHELVAKDLYYLWASAYDEETSRPRFLANAIRMMRETNPENRNLPYMLSDYANRIFFIGTKEQKASYLRELGPSAGQTPGETAFGLYDEALKHFEQHDGDATASIVFLKCRIAMVLTAEKKFAKASPYSEACRNPPGSLGKAQLEAVRNFVRQIDELKRNPAN